MRNSRSGSTSSSGATPAVAETSNRYVLHLNPPLETLKMHENRPKTSKNLMKSLRNEAEAFLAKSSKLDS